MIDSSQNYFALFQLPVAWTLDSKQLAQKYRALQRAVHPDRFAGDSARQQRLAVQYAAYINEAYTTLQSPLSRAIYLLQLAGHPVEREQNTVRAPDFLMEQMALREALASLDKQPDPQAEQAQLTAQINAKLATYHDEFAAFWHGQAWEQAADVVYKMQFMTKVADELARLSVD